VQVRTSGIGSWPASEIPALFHAAAAVGLDLQACAATEAPDGSSVKVCYVEIMSLGFKELLEKTASWPKEDQEELAAVAAEIEARRTGRYTLTDAERIDVSNGLEQVRRGEFASDLEMQSFWKRFGVE
jgi:hypothetical protein